MKNVLKNIGKGLLAIAAVMALSFGFPWLLVNFLSWKSDSGKILTTLEVAERQEACAKTGGISVVKFWVGGERIGQPRDVECENIPTVKVFPEAEQVPKEPTLPDDYITPEFLHKFAMECALNEDNAVFVGTTYDLIGGEYTRYPNFVACRKVKS